MIVEKNARQERQRAVKFIVRFRDGRAFFILLITSLVSLFLALSLLESSLIVAMLSFVVPVVLAFIFNRKFIIDKPQGYIKSWYEESLFGGAHIRKTRKK